MLSQFMVITGHIVLVLFFAFLLYVAFLAIKPPGRQKYIEVTNRTKAELEQIYLKGIVEPESQQFAMALIACSVASVKLKDLFEELDQTRSKLLYLLGERSYSISGTVRTFVGVIRAHASGTYAHDVRLTSEISRLTKKEWKPNRKVIKKLEKVVNINSLDSVLIGAYNNLGTGDAQLAAIKQWKAQKRKQARAEDLKRFLDMATVVGGGAILLVGGMSSLAGSSAKDFGSTPNPTGEEWINKETGEVFDYDPGND